MILNFWSTGELKREYSYYNGIPCMEIIRPLDSSARGFRILLNAAFKYAEPTNETEVSQVLKAALNGSKMLNIPPDAQSLARLVNYVADGLDDLIKMKPEDREKKVIGEGEASFNGEKPFTFEVTDTMLH